MVEAADEVRNAIAIGALQAAGGNARADPVQRRSDGPAGHAAGAVIQDAEPRRDLATGRRPLADRFRGINGVSTVDVNGSLKRELSVLLRAQKLREYNVSVNEVVGALRRRTPRPRWAR
jgi:multidrug efflux pump subunit AcrB